MFFTFQNLLYFQFGKQNKKTNFQLKKQGSVEVVAFEQYSVSQKV